MTRRSIYRCVDLRLWSDERVRRLSRPAPNGRDCWLYLLTAKESCVIPGVIPAGAGAMAETLRWSVEAFREAFGEVSREGMAKADWDALLVWIPNAPAYNPPASPNVILAWGKAWETVPECALKGEIFRDLRAFAEGLGPTYLEAFAKAFREPSPNQEQEQEQEQEKGSAVPAPPVSPAPPAKKAKKALESPADPRHAPLSAALVALGWPHHGGRTAGALKALLKLADQVPRTAGDAAQAEVMRRAAIAKASSLFPVVRELHELADKWGHFEEAQRPHGRGPSPPSDFDNPRHATMLPPEMQNPGNPGDF